MLTHDWCRKNIFVGTIAACLETIQTAKSWSQGSVDREHVHTKVKKRIKYLKVGPQFLKKKKKKQKHLTLKCSAYVTRKK